MANEIQLIHDDGAETVYAIVRDMLGNWYHGTNPEAFDDANWGDYDIALAEVHAAASGNVAVQATFPAVAAGFYWLDVYVQAGANPAQTDFRVSSCLMYWNATALVPAGGAADARQIYGTDLAAAKVPATLAAADCTDGYLPGEGYSVLDWHVDPTLGSDINDGHSWAKAKQTIAATIAAMSNYDSLHIRGQINEGVDLNFGGLTGIRIIGYGGDLFCAGAQTITLPNESRVSGLYIGGISGAIIALGNGNTFVQDCEVYGTFTGSAWVLFTNCVLAAVTNSTPNVVIGPGCHVSAIGSAIRYSTDVESRAKEASVGAIATILTGITSLAAWLRGLYRKDTINSTALSEINSSGGAYSATTDSNEAIADKTSGLTAQETRDAMKLAPSEGDPAAGSIDAELDVLLGGGGATTDTIIVTDPNDAPLDQVGVWITNDNNGVDGGVKVAGSKHTNDSGVVVFSLDDGYYWVHCQLSGFDFSETYPKRLLVANGSFSWA